MSQKVIENIRKFNQAKEYLGKQGIEISQWDMKTKKICLVKNGNFAGYLDLANDSLELRK